MEDYIFIIIAIILSAIGAVNRNKKQKMARMRDEEIPERPPSFFNQFVGDSLFDDEPVPTVIQKPVATPVSSIKTQFEPLKREPIIKKTEPVIKKTPILLEEEPETESRFDAIMKDFSLKKAVIYSEILNRKY